MELAETFAISLIQPRKKMDEFGEHVYSMRACGKMQEKEQMSLFLSRVFVYINDFFVRETECSCILWRRWQSNHTLWKKRFRNLNEEKM